MDLIIKPTQACNFKCTFCSSTDIASSNKDLLDLNHVYRFIERFPDTRTIIVNGGDPLVVKPSYYQELIDYLDRVDSHAIISMTSNLWDFYKRPEKWLPILRNPRVQVCTSFQYGDSRRITKSRVFKEEDFLKISDMMLD